MLIDHFALFILSELPFFTAPFLTLAGKSLSLYYISRSIGRISFPLYCFLISEGFLHTGNRKRYAIRLFAFALISEIPWNLAHSGGLLYPAQNVMFTLLFGYLALWAIEYFGNDTARLVSALGLIFVAAILGNADYGLRGLGLILVIYLLRRERAAQALVGTCMLGTPWAALAFVPVAFYNGERGFMRGALSKYICYLFYPAHLLLIGILRKILF